MKKVRVVFTLSMPGRSSWDGRWSGQDKNYQVVRTLDVDTVARLFQTGDGYTWSHRWSDGWCASISARILTHVDRLKKSDGFNGYDWMIDNIIKNGSPYSEVTS